MWYKTRKDKLHHRMRLLWKIVRGKAAVLDGQVTRWFNGQWHGNRLSLILRCHVVQGRGAGEAGTPGPVPAIPPYTHPYYQLLVSEWHICDVHVVPLKLI